MSEEITVDLKFFASCREIAGTSNCSVTLPKTKLCVLDLINHVLEIYPDLSESVNEVSIAVNKKYIEDTAHELQQGDVIAFIPPISGG